MPVWLDSPPALADQKIDAAIAERLPHSAALGLAEAVSVTRPLLRRYFTVGGTGRLALRLSTAKFWDYFIVDTEAVVIGSLREDPHGLAFEGLVGGQTASRVLTAVTLVGTALESRRQALTLRLLECRGAQLLSVVAQSASGRGYYLNVVDKVLVADDALTLIPDLRGLRELARERLNIARATQAGNRLL